VTASELAFLALGLVLGVGVGAALLVVSGSRGPRREIRVTVTRDALPTRSATLSQGAFATNRGSPAPGGPGDRRWFDRDARTPESAPLVSAYSWSSEQPALSSGPASEPLPERAPIRPPDRTIVPSGPAARPALTPVMAPQASPAGSARVATAISIEPEPSPELEEVRRRPARGPLLERMLRGEHLAMVEAVDAIAGPDGPSRREWEVLLGGLVEAMAEMAVREAVIDFPMGTAFWDTFTIEQCRRIVSALASMGYRYDGADGWAESRVPAYRDMSTALADVGIEPRRVRAWPHQQDIATLFVGARPAPEELLPAAGPDYTATEMQALVGDRATELADLWIAWDTVKATLLAEAPPAAAEASTAASAS
jgi:hypothetical protein